MGEKKEGKDRRTLTPGKKRKTAILSKNFKIKHIEKKIQIGMQKIPEKDRKEIWQQERTRQIKETQQIKQDPWRLPKKEKKP